VEIAVRFHTDRYVARRSDNPRRSEWPPSPDRMYQSLTAAACRLSDASARAAARQWIEWLSTLPAPTIIAVPAQEREATHASYAPRGVVSTVSVKKTQERIRAINVRQDLIRLVETALVDPLVVFRYAAEIPEEFREIAASVAANVSYLGASESPVLVTIGQPVDVSSAHVEYLPDDRGTTELPVPYPGRLADLDAMFEAEASRIVWEPRRRIPGRMTRYATPGERIERERAAVGDLDLMVPLAFRRRPGTSGPMIDSVYFSGFVAAARAAYLDKLWEICPEGSPGCLTGHDHTSSAPETTSYPGAHVAFIPLADVGFRYASSRLRGVGLVLPRGIDSDLRRQALRAFDLDRITVAGEGYELVHRTAEDSLRALRPANYAAGAETWVTHTPIRLWKMPNRSGNDIPDLVAAAVRQAGYPDPVSIETSPVPYAIGSHHVKAYANRFDKPYWLVHARISFSQRVVGPMIVGRGRYVGFGLCAPEAQVAA
jgi:CRISPR-associated protein Csb2